jgi:pantoate--beta-alanine ligase
MGTLHNGHLMLHEILTRVAKRLAEGVDFAPLQREPLKHVSAAGFTHADYFELRDCDYLQRLEPATTPARLFAAAWLAGVRLIDNIDRPVTR